MPRDAASQLVPCSSISQTASRLSRVTRNASSTTASGTARFGFSGLDDDDNEDDDEEVPLTLFDESPLVVAPLDLPFAETEDEVVDEEEASRTSSMMRRNRSGNVVISPVLRSERAWLWTRVGQFEELELRAWRRAS